MKRRHFLAGLGVGATGLADGSNGAMAASASVIGESVIVGRAGLRRGAMFSRVAIIGVGGAGCNLLSSLRTFGVFDRFGPRTELIAVDTCFDTLSYVEATNRASPERCPIKTVDIEFGSGASVDAGWVAAWWHRDQLKGMVAAALWHRNQLKGMVAGAGVAVLIAGLGRGTGSGVTLKLATMARAAGAMTVVLAVTPFDFEGVGKQMADATVEVLRRHADLTMSFSNQALGDELGDGATIEDVFTLQQQRIAVWLTSVFMPGHTSLGPGNGLTP